MSADPRIPRCRNPTARCGRTRGPALALQVRAQPDAVVAPDDIIQRRIRDLRRLTLTYDKLLQLSERLKIPMAELFAEPGDGHEAAVAAGRKRMLPVLTPLRMLPRRPRSWSESSMRCATVQRAPRAR